MICAALQLVVVTVLDRPGKPPCALEASPPGVVPYAPRDAPLCSPVSSLLKETQPSLQVRRQRRAWTMGNVSVGVLALSRLCTFAGLFGEVPALR